MKKCFLCGLTDSIINFDEETFQNCFSKLLYRREKNFKYHDVELTKESVEFIGYHSSCYKKVTVLKKKYAEDYQNFMKKHGILSNTSAADEDPLITKEEGTSIDATFAFSMDVDKAPSPTSTWPDLIDEMLDSVSSNPDTTAHSESSMMDNSSELAQTLDSSTSTVPSKTSTSAETITCLFCSHKQKKSGKEVLHLIFPQSDKTVQQIKTTAETLNDSEMLLKIESQNVAYHKVCLSSYHKKGKRLTEEHVDTSWHQYRRLHKVAYESLSNFITKEIIENSKVMYFAQLFSRYQALLLEFGENTISADDIADYRSETLEKKVLNSFGDRITIEASTGPRCKKIVYKTDIDASVMADNIKFLETKGENKFEEVAYELRNCVKNMHFKQLPTHLTSDDVSRGECEIPDKLFEFMRNLIAGPDVSSHDLDDINVKVTSLCSDIIYAITKGKCKPAKHLTLGLAIKSLTNSRQVITMLNRYGHSIGYDLAEELETETTCENGNPDDSEAAISSILSLGAIKDESRPCERKKRCINEIS